MSNDAQLKQAVLDELKWEPSVNAAHIGVTAEGGVISLMGHVESYGEKLAAETAAGRVRGVKGIAEEIEVKLPFSVERGDDDIASAALSRLAWDASIPKDAIKVKVEKGWVTLTGQADWNFQKDAAAREIRSLMGVRGVSNHVSIKARADTADISDTIMSALNRSWYSFEKVKVTATGGKVQLSGTVHAWADRQMAASAAWSAPGTISVENNIAVS